ncbi:unnamed protein product [Trichogramma brassicae]|uniref:Integrase catalytic domain-containing protein n=1 Tax=Trichogramma brassicae TaxID=86971 RepID=A0A6H5II26_9HYME|nr:unnamed protein product [Trichogramma brassicae]
MKNIFVAHDLLGYVEGTNKKPTLATDNSNQAAVKTWMKSNAEAMSILSTAMEYPQLEYLITCSTAAEMWNKLSSIHEQKTATNKLALTTKFHEYRMSPNDATSQHISKVENMASQLKDVGAPVSEVMIMAKILGSLPTKYHPFISAWESVPEENQTLDNLRERLLREEDRQRDSDDVNRALASMSLPNDRKQEKPRSSSSNHQNGNKKRVICNFCKKPGHLAKYCYAKKRQNKNTNKNTRGDGETPNSSESTPNYSAFIALDSATSSCALASRDHSKHVCSEKDRWFLDSGASQHISHCKDWFAELLPSNADEYIYFGDGTSRKVEGRGKIFIKRLVGGEWHDVWHERLGHVNRDFVYKTFKNNAITGAKLTDSNDYFCESCPIGKQSRLPFSNKDGHRRSITPGEVLHTDLCGPMQEPSVGGARFFLLFKDEASGFRKVFFLKHKSDCFEALKTYVLSVNTRFNRNVKVIRSDNGTEYTNANVNNFLKNLGTELTTSAPYSPQQNGRAEREMRSIVESARTMLLGKQMPKRLWAEAVNTAVYILNRTVNSFDSAKTPYEMWFSRKPDLSHIRTFGSECFAQVPDALRKKWDPKARKLLLVGYENESANYRLFDSDTGTISVSRNVSFNENMPAPKGVFEEAELWLRNGNIDAEIAAANAGEGEPNDVEVAAANAGEDEPNDAVVAVNEEWEDARDASLIDNNENDIVAEEPAPRNTYNLRERNQIQPPKRYEANTVLSEEPRNYNEAINCPNSASWKRAIAEELQAHARNQTWEIAELPDSRKAVGFRWTFKIKNSSDGREPRYKARLCAQGFLQEAGTDYDEIFSPVVRFESIRVLLAIAVRDHLHSAQFDVSTAYLNSELTETIYMRVPDGLNVNKNNAVLKLNKAIYGLKQSGRCWNERFDAFIKSAGFKQSNADKSTRNYGIMYDSRGSDKPLVGYSDADYANDIDTRRSTTGYAFMMSAGCVVWASRRQACVSLSTTEAEYIAASEATKEIVWLRKLLADIDCECLTPTILYIDNQSAIRLTRNPVFHRRSKHIDVRYQFINEKMKENVIDTRFVKSGDQYADIFTKGLPSEKFNNLRDKLNVIEYAPKASK